MLNVKAAWNKFVKGGDQYTSGNSSSASTPSNGKQEEKKEQKQTLNGTNANPNKKPTGYGTTN
jgi:hypothetical protein